MEPLQELPIEKYPDMMKKLKNIWPQNMGGYYALKMNMKCKEIKEYYKFVVYCPYGDMDSGAVLFRRIQNGEQQVLNIFSVSEETGRLEEALQTTKVINWNRKLCFQFVPSKLIGVLLNVIKPLRQYCDVDSHMLSLFCRDANSEKFDLRYPNDTYIAPVKTEHIERINHVWPHKHPNSYGFFAILTAGGYSYGLFSKTNDELLAWLFIGDYGHICHLYCEEKHRRKGYCTFLTKYVVNELISQGDDIFGFVLHGNKNSIELFQKLGFMFGDDCVYLRKV